MIFENDAYCEDCGKETLWLWKQRNLCSTFGPVYDCEPCCPTCGSSRISRKETPEEIQPLIQILEAKKS
jgi:hypothetical protein